MPSIRLENYDAIMAKLDRLENLDNLGGAMAKACAVVERSAKTKAPSKHGDLRRSITSRVENNTQGIIYSNLFYAPYLEYGTGLFSEKGGRSDVPWKYKDDEGNWHTTSGITPHPYLRPALSESAQEIIKCLKEGLKFD